ncbi:MAG: hypothetical protein HYZ45_06690 [Burkholderiales bacterium]|nr:hypothetical protein [Burkholderiales bacterium]
MISVARRCVALAVLFSLAACSPKYDWRDVHGSNSPFAVTMPGKPSEYTRPVQLDQMKANMTMTATQVDGATFAVGAAELPDAAKAQAALTIMQTALVKNIDGKISKTKTITQTTPKDPYPYTEIEAAGIQQIYGKTAPVLLLGRFVAVDKRVYQVIVAGEGSPAMREAAETFLTSFKPN